jgi:protoporphyrin/coproporphyrin ferrochelatase
VNEAGARPIGVLVMAHGTPATVADIEPFYTAIRRGHRPTSDQLDELVARYEAIGGTSPLTERTRAQVDGLAAALEAAAPGRFLVGFGSKYVSPVIEEGMAALIAAGVGQVVAIVLTPHRSTLGSGQYLERAAVAASAAAPPVRCTVVDSWHRSPGLAELLADRARGVLATLDAEQRRRPAVLFTAHSLPLRAVAEGDPYPRQVAESAADIAAILGFDAEPGLTWGVAWQSAGRTADPWMGPDLLAEMRRAAAEGATAVVVVPVGFVSDHLEILYDLDIEARRVASSLGVAFARTPSLNDDPRLSAILADVVEQAAGSTAAASNRSA